jgi:hypothetical protein
MYVIDPVPLFFSDVKPTIIEAKWSVPEYIAK